MNVDGQPRRLLFVIPSLRGGGAERVIVTLLRRLNRDQFACTLAVVDMNGAAFAEDIPPHVNVIPLNASRVRNALPKILWLIWRLRPNVVFSTLGHLNLAIAICRALLPNDVRYIARETSIVSQLPNAYSIPRWWFWAYRRFYRRFDIVVCQSSEMRVDLMSNFGIADSKTVVIGNPIDIELVRKLSVVREEGMRSSAAVSGLKLVAAGSLTYVKGFDQLIEALALCNQRAVPFHLTLIGEGPLRSDLEKLVRERCLAEKVSFVGFKKNPYFYFAQSDALAMSSRFEGFPNVALEAMACGTPVVALACPGGVREMIGDVKGCIVTQDNSIEALAAAICAFPIGQRLPASVVARYDVVNVTAQYEEIFR